MAYRNKVIRNEEIGQYITFLQTAKDTGGTLLEMEASFSSVSKEPPAHYHPLQTEVFTIVEGELSVRINGAEKKLKQGEILTLPPKTVHSMWNSSGKKTVVNWRVMPALNTEYLFETIAGLSHAGKLNKNGRPSFLQAVLFANYFSDVFRLSKPSYPIQKILFTVATPIALVFGYKAIDKRYVD